MYTCQYPNDPQYIVRIHEEEKKEYKKTKTIKEITFVALGNHPF